MAIQHGLTHGVKYQTRSLAAKPAVEGQQQRWIVGTNALREENEVQVIEFDVQTNRISTAEVYTHGSEVWQVAPSPSVPHTLATIYNEGGRYGAAVWRMEAGVDELKRLVELKGHRDVIRSLTWQPGSGARMATVETGHLRTWDLGDGQARQSGEAPAPDLYQLWMGTWDPHDPHRFCTAGGNNIQVWDLRSLTKVGEVEGAHVMPVRDLDFAKQKGNLLVSGGDDHRVCFWDLRVLGSARPLQQRSGHSHWVWQTRFNPTHDSLVLSAASDSLVNLWYLPGLTSETAGEMKGSRDVSPTRNHITSSLANRGHNRNEPAHSYDDHDDSVYGVAWSSIDPWTFASVSYDGRLAINQVSSQVKYKILI